MDEINLEQIVPASAQTIYKDWLSSDGHQKITGGEANITDIEGGDYSAWDGYIWGKNITLVINEKIIQTWRTSEFDESAEDSLLEIRLEALSEKKTNLKLRHTNLPIGDRQKYTDGWIAHYFEPMIAYYS